MVNNFTIVCKVKEVDQKRSHVHKEHASDNRWQYTTIHKWSLQPTPLIIHWLSDIVTTSGQGQTRGEPLMTCSDCFPILLSKLSQMSNLNYPHIHVHVTHLILVFRSPRPLRPPNGLGGLIWPRIWNPWPQLPSYTCACYPFNPSF